MNTRFGRRLAALEAAHSTSRPCVVMGLTYPGEPHDQARAAILAAAGVEDAEVLVMVTKFNDAAVAEVRAGDRQARCR